MIVTFTCYEFPVYMAGFIQVKHSNNFTYYGSWNYTS